MMDETINARLGRMMIGQGDIVEYRGRRQRVLCTRDFGDDKECCLEPERRWVKVSDLTLAANHLREAVIDARRFLDDLA